MQLVESGGFIKIESQNETETLPIVKKCLEIRLHKKEFSQISVITITREMLK